MKTPLPDADSPVFLAGTDRSGIGLLGEALERHSDLALSRRTRFWTLYHERFGDLTEAGNADRAVDAIMRNRRITDLGVDSSRLLADALELGDRLDYAALFALVQRQHLAVTGCRRWVDKTLNAERHAATILEAFPKAKIIHVVRDPRDRYASQATHRSASRGKVGAGTALWLSSVRRGQALVASTADRYRLVRYEDLVTRPQIVVDEVCAFIDEDAQPEMVHGAGGFSTGSIGRYRVDLAPDEVAFIQLVAGRAMRRLGYDLDRTRLSVADRARLIVKSPARAGQMLAWLANAWVRDRRPRGPGKLADPETRYSPAQQK